MPARRLVVLAVGALVASASLAPLASARTLERLDVRRAVVDVDRGHVVLDLRCRASRAACRGALRATSFDGEPITTPKRVQLDRRRTRRVALRLRPDGLRRFASSVAPPDTLVDAELRTARNVLVGEGIMRARVGCRGGHTVATSPAIRVLRVDGLGVYVCERASGRVSLLSTESETLDGFGVASVRLAGPYVAFAASGGFKCFQEARGTEGVVPVRVMDDAGTRLLESGPDVDPASLRSLDAARIAWSRGGVLRVAPLG